MLSVAISRFTYVIKRLTKDAVNVIACTVLVIDFSAFQFVMFRCCVVQCCQPTTNSVRGLKSENDENLAILDRFLTNSTNIQSTTFASMCYVFVFLSISAVNNMLQQVLRVQQKEDRSKNRAHRNFTLNVYYESYKYTQLCSAYGWQ